MSVWADWEGVVASVREGVDSTGDMCASQLGDGPAITCACSISGLTATAAELERSKVESGVTDCGCGSCEGEQDLVRSRLPSGLGLVEASNTPREIRAWVAEEEVLEWDLGKRLRGASEDDKERVEMSMAERARREVKTPCVVPSTSVKMECELERALSCSAVRTTELMPAMTAWSWWR